MVLHATNPLLVSKMGVFIKRNYVNAVSHFDCLLEFCRERKLLTDVSLYVGGRAATENDRLHPLARIRNSDEIVAARNSPLTSLLPAIHLYSPVRFLCCNDY